jgi:ATP-binding cassette subfamily B protein
VAIVLVFGAIVAVLWSGAHDVIAGRMSAGTLGQFVLYALIGGGSVARWPKCGTTCSAPPAAWDASPNFWANTRPSPCRRIRSPAATGAGTSISSTWTSATLASGRAALDGFNLHVRPGETVALVGPSGAGKSTVLSMLLRFHDPLAGRITVDGIDCANSTPRRCARRSRWCRSSRCCLPPARPTTSATDG